MSKVLTFLGCILVAGVMTDGVLLGQDTRLAKQFHHSFKDNPAARQSFELFGQDAAKHVRFEQDGLRIALPAGPKRAPTTGVETLIDVGGDFEITVAFEVLAEPVPAGGRDKQSRFTVDIVLDKPGLNAASVSRTIYGKGVEVATWSALQAGDAEKPTISMHYFAAGAKNMRLRLLRTGAVLAYESAEGDGDFVRHREDPFGAENLTKVRCVATTGAADAELDVRVTDLRIRAESLDRTTASDAPANARSFWWLLPAAALVLLLGAAVVLRRFKTRSQETRSQESGVRSQKSAPD